MLAIVGGGLTNLGTLLSRGFGIFLPLFCIVTDLIIITLMIYYYVSNPGDLETDETQSDIVLKEYISCCQLLLGIF